MKKIAIIVGSILLIIIIGMLCMHGNERNTEVTKERTRVGFIYNGTIDDKGWGQSHYEGISKSAKELNLAITYKENVSFDDSCMTVMKDMIDGGCEIIICNSFNYGDYILLQDDLKTITFVLKEESRKRNHDDMKKNDCDQCEEKEFDDKRK